MDVQLSKETPLPTATMSRPLHIQPPKYLKVETAVLFDTIVKEMISAGVTIQPWHAAKIELLAATVEHMRTVRNHVRSAGIVSIDSREIEQEWIDAAEGVQKLLLISRPALQRLINGQYR